MTESRDRDDVIDRWLRRAASASGPGPNAACLDAEVMAAWADGGLSDSAVQAVRAHVADCARCQVLAAVMTKLEPAAAAADDRRPVRAADRQSRNRPWLNWLVPVAAVAGAVAIWVFIPRPAPDFQQVAAPPAPATQVAQAPPAPAQEALAAAKPEPPKLKAEQASAAKRQAPAKNEKDQNRDAQAFRAEESRVRAQAPPDPKKTDTKALALPAPPPPPPAAPPPPATVAVTGAAPVVAPPPAAVAQSANRVAGGGGGGRGGGGGQGAGGGQRAAESVADARLSKEIVSTDDATRWRISVGTVEKSIDAGRTWAPVKTGVSAEFTAGASPSSTTCWLVGRRGVVLLTTDGQTWRPITFPVETDLSAVRATDARTATVTTADGREYSTTNGGNSWIRR